MPKAAKTTPTRPLKKLHSAQSWSPEQKQTHWQQIVQFLQEIQQSGLKSGRQYLVPTLEAGGSLKEPGYLTLSKEINQESYQNHFSTLLPADIAIFFSQISAVLVDQSQQANFNNLAYLQKALTQAQISAGDSFIETSQEQALYQQIKNHTKKIAKDLIRAYQVFIGDNSAAAAQEEDSPSPETKEAESTASDQPPATASAPKDEADTAGPDTDPETQPEPSPESQSVDQVSLLDRQAQLTIDSVSILAINSVLALYTQTADQTGLSFQQLPPALQTQFLNQLKPKVEALLLGLTDQERQQFVQEGNFALRLKLLQQVHYYILANPSSRQLLQASVNHQFNLLRHDQAKQQQLQQQVKNAQNPQKAHEALKQAAQENQTFVKLRLPQHLADVDSYQDNFVQILQSLSQLETTQLQLALTNANNTIAAFTIDDPFLTPDFIDYLTPTQFQAIFANQIPAEILAQNQAQIRLLFKQYWAIHRAKIFAKLLRDNPDLLLHYQKKPQAVGAENKKQAAQTDARLQRVALIRQGLKTQELDPEEAVEAKAGQTPNNSKHQKINQALNKATWDTASKRKKQAYLLYAHGPNAQDQLATGQLQEQVILAQFNFIKFMNASIMAESMATQAASERAIQNELYFQHQLLKTQMLMQAAAESDQDQLSQLAQAPAFQALNSPSQLSSEQQVLSQAQQAAQQAGALLDQGLEFAAEKGVEAGLMYATGGGYAAIPAPLRKLINKQLGKKAKTLLKIGLGAALGTAGLWTALIAKFGTPAIGGLIGMSLGPIGAVAGAGIGVLVNSARFGTLSKWWDALVDKINPASGASATQALGQGAKNAQAALGDLGQQALGGKKALATPAQFGKTAWGKSAAAKTGLWHTLSTSTAAQAITTYITVTVAGSLLTLTVIQSAFLVDVPYTPQIGTLTSDFKESKYVKIEKNVIVANCPEKRCELDFPQEITYNIKITPKEDFTLTISQIEDNISVSYNKDEYSTEKLEELNSFLEDEKLTRTFADFNSDQAQPFKEGFKILPNSSLSLSYTHTLTQEYNHANIRNIIKIDFAYSNDTESGTSDAITGEVLCLGECPEGLGCWPTTGQITQLPGGDFSHSGVDAIDIGAVTGKAIFAPYNGLLCPGNKNPNVYGSNLKLTSTINDEEYIFIFGHMLEGHSLVEHGCKDVQEGQIIGRVDSGGVSTGPHLHYELANSPLFGGSNSLQLRDLVPDGWGVTSSPRTPVRSCFSEIE